MMARPRVSSACAWYRTAEGTTVVARARSDSVLQPACAVPSLAFDCSVKQLQVQKSNCSRGGGGGKGGGGGGEGRGLRGGGGGNGCCASRSVAAATPSGVCTNGNGGGGGGGGMTA